MGGFEGLPKQHFGAILADPPWSFTLWNGRDKRVASRGSVTPYDTMDMDQIAALPVTDVVAENCVLFLWCSWPSMPEALDIIKAWDFKYKTCGFLWAKAHANQLEMFRDDIDAYMGLGYWTRANSEPCLLATRGNP